MTLHRTLWRPDTCGCELEYSWDDEIRGVENTMKLYKVHKRCPAHVEEDPLMAVLEENQRKNRALSEILDFFPQQLGKDVKDEKGKFAGRWFEREPPWSFTEDRTLRVDLGDLLLPVEKEALRAMMRPKKVEVL